MNQYHPQQGGILLLMTLVLSFGCLLIMLSHYKSNFYQLKRAQNQYQSIQSKWFAEAGLECLFAHVYAGNVSLGMNLQDHIIDCELSSFDPQQPLFLLQTSITTITSNQYQVTMRWQWQALTKQFVVDDSGVYWQSGSWFDVH